MNTVNQIKTYASAVELKNAMSAFWNSSSDYNSLLSESAVNTAHGRMLTLLALTATGIANQTTFNPGERGVAHNVLNAAYSKGRSFTRNSGVLPTTTMLLDFLEDCCINWQICRNHKYAA